MNINKFVNLVYKNKKIKTEKSGAVDRIKMIYSYIEKVFKTST